MDNRLRQRVSTSTLIAATAMMAVTMVGMVGCDTPQLQDERNRLFMQNQELEQALVDARATQDALQAENQRLRDQLAQRPPEPVRPEPRASANTGFSDIAGVETEHTAAGAVVRVPGDVLFAPGEAEVRSGARGTLQQIARAIQREYADHTIRIEGYTDTDPIRASPWTDNLELSAHRAMAVQRYLAEQGIDANRMYAAGFGESRPRETKEQSRRVEIVVVKYE